MTRAFTATVVALLDMTSVKLLAKCPASPLAVVEFRYRA